MSMLILHLINLITQLFIQLTLPLIWYWLWFGYCGNKLIDWFCLDQCFPPHFFRYVIVDTPGQIEVFTWSASGAIISETMVTITNIFFPLHWSVTWVTHGIILTVLQFCEDIISDLPYIVTWVTHYQCDCSTRLCNKISSPLPYVRWVTHYQCDCSTRLCNKMSSLPFL